MTVTAPITFGLGLLPQYPPDQFVRLVRQAERRGFDCVWVPDERFYRECYSYLTLCAVNTERVRMGPCVTDPYSRHPSLTAMALGTVDEASGGRAVLGIGAGASGLDALRISRKKPAVAMREAVGLIRTLWAGEEATVDGEVITFTRGRLNFRARPDIPIYIAGRGPKILELAGEIADGVIIGALASPPTLGYAMTHIERGRRRARARSRPQEIVLWLHTAIGVDGAAARDAVRRIVVGVLISSLPVLDELGVALPEPLRDRLGRITYGVQSPEMIEAAALVPDDVLAHFTMAGDGAFCRERVDALAQGGVNHVAVLPWLLPGQSIEAFVDVFADELIVPR
jgi:5,10-methylenetetrahydromethanopterin reductase